MKYTKYSFCLVRTKNLQARCVRIISGQALIQGVPENTKIETLLSLRQQSLAISSPCRIVRSHERPGKHRNPVPAARPPSEFYMLLPYFLHTYSCFFVDGGLYYLYMFLSTWHDVARGKIKETCHSRLKYGPTRKPLPSRYRISVPACGARKQEIERFFEFPLCFFK